MKQWSTQKTSTCPSSSKTIHKTKWSAQWRKTPSPRRWKGKLTTSRQIIVAWEFLMGSMKAACFFSWGILFREAAISSCSSVKAGRPLDLLTDWRGDWPFAWEASAFPLGEEIVLKEEGIFSSGVATPEVGGEVMGVVGASSDMSMTVPSISRSSLAKILTNFARESSFSKSLIRAREDRECKDKRTTTRTMSEGITTGRNTNTTWWQN